MEILRAEIIHLRRDRDFGRIEAWVDLVLQPYPALPARRDRIFASVPARPAHGGQSLRDRLTAEAARIALLFSQAERDAQRAAAA